MRVGVSGAQGFWGSLVVLLPPCLYVPPAPADRHMHPLVNPKSEITEPNPCGAETLVVSLLQVLTQT